MSSLAPIAPIEKGLRATPMLAARRARELAEIHNAVCRARRQGLVCSTCTDLNGRASRLEANRG